jgi:hypothetical protein
VLVRTERGMELLELARSRGVLEFRAVPEGNLEKLEAASLGKKRAAKDRLSRMPVRGSGRRAEAQVRVGAAGLPRKAGGSGKAPPGRPANMEEPDVFGSRTEGRGRGPAHGE